MFTGLVFVNGAELHRPLVSFPDDFSLPEGKMKSLACETNRPPLPALVHRSVLRHTLRTEDNASFNSPEGQCADERHPD